MVHWQSYHITANITATDTWKPCSSHSFFSPPRAFSLSISSSTHSKARACNLVGLVHMCWCHHPEDTQKNVPKRGAQFSASVCVLTCTCEMKYLDSRGQHCKAKRGDSKIFAVQRQAECYPQSKGFSSVPPTPVVRLFTDVCSDTEPKVDSWQPQKAAKSAAELEMTGDVTSD